MNGVLLPDWAVVSEKRRAHIGRVTALLDRWAADMDVGSDEASCWHDAGLWHDGLRDAPEELLRSVSGDHVLPFGVLHGPAAALKLEEFTAATPVPTVAPLFWIWIVPVVAAAPLTSVETAT